jgi:hypothetical protein
VGPGVESEEEDIKKSFVEKPEVIEKRMLG